MHVNPTQSNRPFAAESPKPGEIWSLKRLNSDSLGVDPDHYVMIVDVMESDEVQEMGDRHPTKFHPTEPIVTVMVLSTRMDCFSEVDVLLSAEISGLAQNVLAETWHVFPLLESNLFHRVGLQLSRLMYDGLLTLGDAYHGLVNEASSLAKINRLGLKMGKTPTSHPNFQSFREKEETWSAELSIPLATANLTLNELKFAEIILEEAKQWEQDWILLHSVALEPAAPEPVTPAQSALTGGQQFSVLSQWFQHFIAPEWQKISNFWELQPVGFGMARSTTELRTTHSVNAAEKTEREIAELLHQLASSQDDSLHQRIVKRLGMIAVGHTDAIQAIIAMLDHTLNDETLWIAVESLNRIDPDNLVNISRFKMIDLGMQVSGQSVRLVVSLFQKANQQVSVLLRVYPSESDLVLPSGLKLIVLDLAGQVLREITARQSDIHIQLKLSGHRDEAFSVKIALQEVSTTESFLI